MALKTKIQELELEKAVKSQKTRLPHLMLTPFHGTSKGWIRFSDQYYAQVDCHPVSKTVKFGYLLQLVSGPSRDVIRNIPNTGDGYDRVPELLKKEFEQDQAVIVSHTTKILERGVLGTMLGTKY